MYVNRGMIEAARTEGEMAGVMAHEISHVALRHGTAQASKAQKYSILGGIAGIAGTILGGPGVGQLAQAPFAVYLLKFSREYETEADILGAQIMARAGYDPRDLANMFRTIEQQGGGGGGFLSDHPSPNDRYARINQEAQYLRVDTQAFVTRVSLRVFRSVCVVMDPLPRWPRFNAVVSVIRQASKPATIQTMRRPGACHIRRDVIRTFRSLTVV